MNALCCALACVNRYMQIARKTPLDEVARKNIVILLKDITVLKERYEVKKEELGFEGGLSFLNDDTYFDGFKIEQGEFFGDKVKAKHIITKWIADFGTDNFNCYRYEVATYVLFMIQDLALDDVNIFGEDIARLEGREIKKKARIFNIFKKMRAA